MLKSSKDMFSFENHSEKTVDELPENGAVVDADVVDVVAETPVSDDVAAAGDDIGQATPVEEVVADDTADITQTDDAPLDGTTVEEIEVLTQAGQQAAAVKEEIVEAATAEVTGGTADEDVNGNAITPEQAEVNEAEEQVEDEVEEEAEEEAKAKDIHTEATEVEENADEQLGDAIGDATDGGLDAEATDDTSTDIDSAGGEGDLGMDPEAGSTSEPLGEDDAVSEDDDTPLEGAESPEGDVSTDELNADDTAQVEPTDGGELANTPADLGDLEGDSSETEVAKQNEAADVTAAAAAADVDEVDFIADETPEQSGDVSAAGIPEAGDTVVAEATPAIQNEEDVTTAAHAMTGDETEEVVLDGEEDDNTPLDVVVEEPLTPTEVDGQEIDGATNDGATVEESVSDQEAETLNDTVEEVADDIQEEEVIPETEVEETPTVTETDEAIAEAEVETAETDAEEDLEEGIIEIPDVDEDVTDEEIEEAVVEADEAEAEAEAEEIDGDDADKTIEELQREAEALEKYCFILQHQASTESYSPTFLGFALGESARMRTLLNEVGFKVPAVSLEAYGPKDLDLAYKVSIESLRGIISRMGSIQHSLTQKVEKWWSKGLVDKVVKRTTALNKQIDQCLVETKNSGVSNKEVTGIGAYLSYADGNLVKAVARDLKVVTDVSGKGFKATEDFQSNLVKALNDITAAATVEEAMDVVDKVTRLKDTKTAFPNDAFGHGFLGGYKLELKAADGGDTNKAKILNLGRRAVPVVVKSGKGGASKHDLTRGDLANLLSMAKAYVALADKLAKTVGDRAVDNVSKLRLTRERALPVMVEGRIRGGDESAIDAVATAMEIVSKAHNDLYKFVTKHCIDTAEALCGVAKKFNK